MPQGTQKQETNVFKKEYNEDAMGNSPQALHSFCEDWCTDACLG
jgi:hypothetical protein